MTLKYFIATLPAVLAFAGPALAAPPPPGQFEFFETNIRPLLAEHCTDCHGPSKHENGLRLDLQSAVTRGSDYGAVIVPGKPAESKLIKAVKHLAGAEPMPKKQKALTPAQIALLEKWITDGAPWPADRAVASTKPKWQEHWAFQPVRKPEIPKFEGSGALRNPIDAIVGKKLRSAGLKPAPPADVVTLCRRMYLDVLGLQPTFEQVQAFEADWKKDARLSVQKLVTSLLASPHYGERWARYWLDVARYSDTEGYQVAGKDIRYPYAYTYRDWVVKAFNDDLPYDQFLKLQLAADHVTAGSKEPSKDLAALGFLTVNDTFISDRLLQTDDRIDVTARGMLGLTVGCARCHDHKYDPIPSTDYYSMYSIFNSSQIPDELPVIGKPSSDVAYASYQAEVGKVEAGKAEYRKELYDDMRKPERLAAYLSYVQEAESKGLKEEAYRGRAGQLQLRDRVAKKFQALITQVAAPSAPHPAFVAWCEFAALPAEGFEAKSASVVARLSEPGSKCLPEVAAAFKNQPAPKSFKDVAATYASLMLKHEQSANPNDGIRTVLMRPASPMAAGVDEMEQFFTRKDLEHVVKMNNQLKRIEITNPGAPPRAMVMADKPKPSDVNVFIRGNPARQGAPAPRGNLTLLGGQKFKQGSGRLELANAIASKDNPLTARVIVNRIWMQHFGKPLVSSPSDFGVQTSRPEQLELLDYLAASLMEQGWSLKALQQMILTSATYQQSCEITKEKELKDAENNLLSRFNRTRLDYEAMRDCVVQASGVLNTAAMGGRSVPLTTPGVDQWRTIYHFVDRYDQATVPAMFDFANPDSHSAQRYVTTVPQQALFLMNSPFMQTQAAKLAASVPVQGSAPDASTVKALYRRVLLREPKLDELDMAQRFLSDAAQLQSATAFSWQYGTERLARDAAGKPVLSDWKRFAVLKDEHKRPTWSHTGIIPDKEWRYAMIYDRGGHAPADDLVATRRWVSPVDATIRISGELYRDSERGNGVRGLIISERTGLITEALASPANKRVQLTSAAVKVKKGDVLHFCVSPENGETDSDSYEWSPEIALVKADGGTEVLTNARTDFCGTDAWPLNRSHAQPPLQQLAQALLMSNEFMFSE